VSTFKYHSEAITKFTMVLTLHDMHAEAAVTALSVDLCARNDTVHIHVGLLGNPGQIKEQKCWGPGGRAGNVGSHLCHCRNGSMYSASAG